MDVGAFKEFLDAVKAKQAIQADCGHADAPYEVQKVGRDNAENVQLELGAAEILLP